MDDGGDIIDQKGFPLGRRTNNFAEYMGLIKGLERALELGFSEISVLGDSELVVRQMQGGYKVKAKGLKPLHKKARDLMSRFESVRIDHVPRSENREADLLLNEVLASRDDV